MSFPITEQGLLKLEQEIKNLKHVERPAVIEAIKTAREFGDLSENAEYHAAKDKQGFIEAKIKDLEDKYARAEVMHVADVSKVGFGAKVTIENDETKEIVSYTIVGEYEVSLAQHGADKLGEKLISIASPVSRALIGKKQGDYVEVVVPSGVKGYNIVKIEYKEVVL